LHRFGELLPAKGVPTDLGLISREHVEAFIADRLSSYKTATAAMVQMPEDFPDMSSMI